MCFSDHARGTIDSLDMTPPTTTTTAGSKQSITNSQYNPERDDNGGRNDKTGRGFLCRDRTKTFHAYGLEKHLVNKTRELDIKTPSFIQDIAFPCLLKGYDHTVVMGAETGSGKTLAFALPVVHNLLMELKGRSITAFGSQKRRNEAYPLAIVVVPNAELAHQVEGLLSHLCEGTVLSVGLATDGKAPSSYQARGFKNKGMPSSHQVPFPRKGESPSILVTLPFVLKCNISDALALHTRFLVVDEADFMLKEQQRHWEYMKDVFHTYLSVEKSKLHAPMDSPLAQIPRAITIFVAATLGDKHVNAKLGVAHARKQKLRDAISKYFRDAKWLRTPNMHRKLPNIRHSFIFKYNERSEERENTLFDIISRRLTKEQTLKAAAEADKNDRQTPQVPPHMLAASGGRARGLRSKVVVGEGIKRTVQAKLHGQKILVFFNDINNLELMSKSLAGKGIVHGAVHERMEDEERLETLSNYHHGYLRLLLTTDCLARGVDFVKVNCVIQYEMAKNVTNHLHRIGRVGRGGNVGSAYSLFGQFDRKLVNAIRASEDAHDGHVDDLFSKIKPREKIGDAAQTRAPTLAPLPLDENSDDEGYDRAVYISPDRWMLEGVPAPAAEEGPEEDLDRGAMEEAAVHRPASEK